MKAFGLTEEVHWKLGDLSAEEESGTPCVAVKCVDIWKNTSGESGSLNGTDERIDAACVKKVFGS